MKLNRYIMDTSSGNECPHSISQPWNASDKWKKDEIKFKFFTVQAVIINAQTEPKHLMLVSSLLVTLVCRSIKKQNFLICHWNPIGPKLLWNTGDRKFKSDFWYHQKVSVARVGLVFSGFEYFRLDNARSIWFQPLFLYSCNDFFIILWIVGMESMWHFDRSPCLTVVLLQNTHS